MTDKPSNSRSDGGRIDRRKYLAYTAAGVTAFAGCLGDGGGGNGGNGGNGNGDTTPTPTAGNGGNGGGDGDKIPIASFCPLSGAGGAFGPGQQAGFNIAVSDVNDAGGVMGREIDPINRNTETKPSRAASKLKSVISNRNIPAFVGTWSSGVSSTLAPIAADNEIMQMGNGTTSPVLAEMGWREADGEQIKFMGRTSPNDGMQGIAIAQLLNENLNADSAGFMHVDNPYGAGLARKAKDVFEGETTAMVGVAKQTSDYTSALDEVFAGDPDVFVLIVYPANGESILKQWNRGGYGGTLVMSESMYLPNLFDDLSDIVEGSYVTTIRPKKSQSWDYFNKAMEDFGQEVTTFSSHSYDALFLEALAMHKAGEASGTAIAQNIKSVSRPPGEEIFAGSDEFEKAKGLLDDGEEINYQGASSKANLNCFVEPYNRFAINKLEAGDPINITDVDTIPAEYFQGKVYTDEQLEKYNCN